MDVKGPIATALGLMLLPFGAGAQDMTYYFEPEFDVALDVPAAFSARTPAPSGMGAFASPGGDLRIVVTGQDAQGMGADGAAQMTARALFDHGGATELLWSEDQSGLYRATGLRADGWLVQSYGQIGQTCEGAPVLAVLTISHPATDKAARAEVVSDLVASLNIGACG